MSANFTATVNRTQKSWTWFGSCPFNPTALIIGETFALSLFFVVSLAGNTFIGIIVYKTKTMRKPINFFIVNMAMSDLLLPIFLFPWRITEVQARGFWLIGGPLGRALCKLAPFLTEVSTTVSIQSLVLIAVDRFGAVVFPLRSPLISTKLCRVFILATWIVAMAVQSPYLFSFKLAEIPGGLKCLGWWHEEFGAETSFHESYFLAFLIAFIYIPLVLIAILYLAILFKLKSQKIPGEQSVNARERRVKRERNVLKLSIVIVLVFAICWLPFTTCWFLFLFPTDGTIVEISYCSFQYFWEICLFLAFSNCAINPCICFIFNGNYRRGLKNLLSC